MTHPSLLSNKDPMSSRSVTKRSAVLTIASASVFLSFLTVSSVSSASAAESLAPVLTCPAAVGVVDYPVATPRIAESSVVTVTSGALPAGLRLDVGTEGTFLVGKPTTAGTFTFTLHGTADGGTTSSDKACSLTVREAPTVTRIAGVDRYAQSVAVAEANFRSASTVYLASGENYPDALSATATAAAHKAPLLLTTPATLPAAVSNEIQKLDTENIVIVGGTAAVSSAVETQLRRLGPTVVRIGGADRYEVSRNLISDPVFGIPAAESVFLATGAAFPDALTASPAAAQKPGPVLLVNGSETELTSKESDLLDSMGVKDVFIAGGRTAVSAALETDLDASFTVKRYSGLNRFDVGVAINQASFPSASTMYLASGTRFPDALSGGVVAGMKAAPLYLTQNCVDDQLWREIGRLAPTSVVLLGGTAALGPGLDHLKPCTLD
jgi:putative cell wall-binding protein